MHLLVATSLFPRFAESEMSVINYMKITELHKHSKKKGERVLVFWP